MDRIPSRASLPTLLGLATWIAAASIIQPGWAGALFILAPLLAIPLALELLSAPRNTRACFGAAAGFVVASYAVERGMLAAALALPWLAVCVFHALQAMWQWPRPGQLAMLVAAGYLTVGAGWLILARYGARPLGFEDVIVHATAVHFHFAGFVLPVLVHCLTIKDPSPVTRVGLWGVLIGVPLVAGGIMLTVWGVRWLESAATVWLALACWLVAWRQARFALVSSEGWPTFLLLLASLALSIAMALACGYALGQWAETPWLDVPFMLRSHGCLQVFGFALPALIAWLLVRERPTEILDVNWLWFGQAPDLMPWLERPFSCGVERGPGASDHRDNHERVVATEPPGTPVANGPFRRLAHAISSFDVFPPWLAQTLVAAKPVALGDTAGVSYRLAPGCRLFFAARVYECFEEVRGDWHRAGFSYRTLEGHPMCGEETFCVEKNLATGEIVAALRSWSRPVHWSTRWGYPLARRWQLHAGRSALDHLQGLASSQGAEYAVARL